MNKIYLVHCWDGTSNDGWYPWIEKEFKNKLNAKTCIVENKGHISQNDVFELQEILKNAK